MNEKDFLARPYSITIEKGSITCQSPSNIALVKYWGKYGEQLPQNTSVSFTLSKCRTETNLIFQKKETAGFDFDIFLDGQRKDNFRPKIQKFFERIKTYVPFLENYSFKIETTNSFPHSSGIASSASGMSALALCLVTLEKQLVKPNTSEGKDQDNYFMRKASFLARLGSGSASRSLEGPLVVWGKHQKIEASSNLFGIKYPYKVHKNFDNYNDAILLVDKGEKQVSSTVGHDLMHEHPYASERFKEANNNISKLLSVLENGDLKEFIAIVESEALQLHAMMMASQPYFILMKPNTLKIINKIWDYRNKTGSAICFTLDAGANVHILFPENETATVSQFIEDELVQFCKNNEFIKDKVGLGATVL